MSAEASRVAIRWVRPAAVGIALVMFGYVLVNAEDVEIGVVLNQSLAGTVLMLISLLACGLLVVGTIRRSINHTLLWGFTVAAGVSFGRATYFLWDTQASSVWSVVAMGVGLLCAWYATLVSLDLKERGDDALV